MIRVFNSPPGIANMLCRSSRSVLLLPMALAANRMAGMRKSRFGDATDNNKIMAGMEVFYVAGYLIEERRRWAVITASPRGQCSK